MNDHQNSSRTARPSVAVVGGGVIGLSVAWRAAAAGHPTTLVDPDPARAASQVAGGMLAPVTEAWPGEESLLRLGEESLRRWSAYAERVASDAAASDTPVSEVGLNRNGTVVAAHDSGDAAQLDVLAEHLRALGRTAEPVTGRALRALVPGLAGGCRRGLSVPGDLAVDNRRLLAALRTAGHRRGVRHLAEPVHEVTADAIRTPARTVRADAVVLAAGAWSARLHPALATAVRPLKGEVLRLRPRSGCLPPPARTVRAIVEGRPIYLVPRPDGELVVGATQYEAGYDTTVTAGGVRVLLDAAERVLPGLADYELAEQAAGLRAGSLDNLPYLGVLDDGVLVATGHHRHGLLLAPITADVVLELLSGGSLPAYARAADPARADPTRQAACPQALPEARSSAAVERARSGEPVSETRVEARGAV